MNFANLSRFRDPRLTVLIFLSTCTGVFIYANPAYGKSVDRLLMAFGAAAVTDLLIERFFGRKRWRFPLSALTTSTGIVLILFAPQWWVFVLAPAIAILSKYLIRVENLHIFNPNNFAIVFSLLFLGNDVSTTLGRWGGPSFMIYLIVAIGVTVAYQAGRLAVSLAWLSSFIVLAVLRSWQEGIAPIQNLVVMTSPLFYVFSFYHITDPITSPKNFRGQILFAALIATIDACFRVFTIRYSPFLSLFTMTAFQPIFPQVFQRDRFRAVWRKHLPPDARAEAR